MSDIKNKVQGLDPNVRARNMDAIAHKSANIYESLTIITKRARQLSVEIKRELHNKLDEFAISSDAIEEISENKEQIEISKFYERLPNPAIIAMEEFLNDEIVYRYSDRKPKGQEA
jgi:DNA-directed RNA polymerase subunit K/omega